MEKNIFTKAAVMVGNAEIGKFDTPAAAWEYIHTHDLPRSVCVVYYHKEQRAAYLKKEATALFDKAMQVLELINNESGKKLAAQMLRRAAQMKREAAEIMAE